MTGVCRSRDNREHRRPHPSHQRRACTREGYKDPESDDVLELDGDYTLGDIVNALERLPFKTTRVAVVKMDAEVARYLIHTLLQRRSHGSSTRHVRRLRPDPFDVRSIKARHVLHHLIFAQDVVPDLRVLRDPTFHLPRQIALVIDVERDAVRVHRVALAERLRANVVSAECSDRRARRVEVLRETLEVTRGARLIGSR